MMSAYNITGFVRTEPLRTVYRLENLNTEGDGGSPFSSDRKL